MALVMVRRNQLGASKKQHSYFMVSTDDFQGRSLPAESLKAAILGHSVEIHNLGVNHGVLISTSGKMGDYPLYSFQSTQDVVNNCNFKVVESGFALTVLGVYRGKRDSIFAISDGNGKVAVGLESELVQRVRNSNVNLINTIIDGYNHIQSASGSFLTLPATNAKVKAYLDAHPEINIERKVEKPVAPIEKKDSKPEWAKAGKEQAEAYAKIKAEHEKNRAISEIERSERESRGAEKRVNLAAREAKRTIKVGGQDYDLDEDTIRQIQQAREEALQARVMQNQGVLSTKSTSEGDDLDDTSAIAIANGGSITFKEKIIMAALTLKYIDPFLYACYMTLEKVLYDKPVGGLQTMGVTDDKLFIVVPNVAQLELPKISWILLHELSHVIMMHHIRGKNKDKYVYNVACDLFINKMIAVNYGCRPGVPVTKLMYNETAPIGLEFHTFFSDAGYEEALYDESIDVENTTVEMIYDKLMAENKNKMNRSGGADGNSGNQSGPGDEQSGGSDSNGEQNQGNSSDNQQGGSEGSQSSDGQEKDKSGSSSLSGNKNEQSGTSNGQSRNDNGQGENQSGQGSDKGGQSSDEGLTFNGKKVAPLPDGGNHTGYDLYKDDDTKDHGDTQEAREEWGKNFIRKITQRAQDLMQTQSLQGSKMLRVANESVMRDFVWTQFVKRYLTKLSEEDYSYKKLNRKMMNHGLVMKGRVPYMSNAEEDVFVCIDVSGSVDDDMLYQAFQYIITLLKKLKLTGSVMYWSTMVDGPYEFKSARDLVKLRNQKYKSSGGTDPTCLFRWFQENRRKHKPKLVIVITDGYFSAIDKSYRPKECETLWIITKGNYRDYKPSFGKVAPLIPKK